MPGASAPTRVCIVATPESTVTPATGLYETLRSVAGHGLIAAEDRREDRPRGPP